MPISMSRTELIALVAAMFACVALSIDSMLPALPQMAAALTPDDPNAIGMVLTVFVLGLGTGTFITGPLSDAFGRRKVLLIGAVLFILAAGLAWASPTLELLLMARFLQGLAAAAPRIVSLAVLRDVFAGRAMAQVMSFVMMVFMIVPALAPMVGNFVTTAFGWPAVFLSFVVFMTVIGLWAAIRLPETLVVEKRRPFRLPVLWDALREMMSLPTVVLSILVQALSMGILFCTLTLVQPIYDQIFDRAAAFPYWFGGVAVLAGTATLLNAKLVVRVGMRRMATLTYLGQMVISALMLVLFNSGLGDTASFAVFVFWQVTIFFMGGLTIGNLNAIAMEPIGHIAGMAASFIGGISTVLAAIIATIVGLTYNGTVLPLVIAVLALSVSAYILMRVMARVEPPRPA